MLNNINFIFGKRSSSKNTRNAKGLKVATWLMIANGKRGSSRIPIPNIKFRFYSANEEIWLWNVDSLRKLFQTKLC